MKKKKEKSSKKIALPIAMVCILAVLTLAAVAVFTRLNKADGQTTSLTAEVIRGSITETIDALGVVSAEPGDILSWESGGIVSAFSVKVGDVVEKGEVLLILDDSSISPEILQARSTLLEAQIEYEKMLLANTDYTEAIQEVNTQELILDNTYNMRHEFYSDDIPDQYVEAAYDRYVNARVEVWDLEAAYESVKKLEDGDSRKTNAYEALQAGIFKRDKLLRALSQILGTPYGQRTEGYFILYDLRTAELAEARAASERLLDNSDELSAAKANLQALQNSVDQASIIAPFSGTVTAVHAGEGGLVSAGDAAVQLDDLSHLIVDLDISQMEINKVGIGQSAELNFDAIPNTQYSGTVVEISNAGVSSDDDTVYKVKVALTDADRRVKPGFTASVNITTSRAVDVLLIPNTAIQYDEKNEPYVLAARTSGTFTSVPIETGARSDAFTELVSGDIQEGDSLAVALAEDTNFQVGSGAAIREARRITGGTLFGR